jgi:hypothetical protein
VVVERGGIDEGGAGVAELVVWVLKAEVAVFG